MCTFCSYMHGFLGGNRQRPNDIFLQFCDMLSIAVSYIVIILNLFPLQIIFSKENFVSILCFI